MSDEYLSIAEAARRLGVSKQTVYRWIQEGYLPAYHRGLGKYGTCVRVADLQAVQQIRPK